MEEKTKLIICSIITVIVLIVTVWYIANMIDQEPSVEGNDELDGVRIVAYNGTTNQHNNAEVVVDDSTKNIYIYLETVQNDWYLYNCKYASINFSVCIEPDNGYLGKLYKTRFASDYQIEYEGLTVLEKTDDTYYANWTYESEEVHYYTTKILDYGEQFEAQINYKFDACPTCLSSILEQETEITHWFVKIGTFGTDVYEKIYVVHLIYKGEV